MVDLGTYQFINLNAGKFTPKEFFMNDYAEEIDELYQVRTSTKRLCTILDAKYEKANI